MPRWAGCVLVALACVAPARAGQEVTLPVFTFASTSAARALWSPVHGPEVEALAGAGQEVGALRFPCPFSSADERCYWDASVRMDLSTYSAFSLRIKLREPDAFSHCTVYFRSGEGWYGGSFRVREPDWQDVRLNRAGFREEGRPAGWHAVDGIRISLWKGASVDSTADIAALTARIQDIVVVRGNRTILKGSSEAESVRRYAAAAVGWLAEAGLDVGMVEDTDVERGALVRYKVAFFPHNPDITAEEAEAVRGFVSGGGKILLAYKLPDRLAPLLGLKGQRWQAEQYAGQYATIRFGPDRPASLPERVIQESWNVTVPALAGATTLGTWEDAGRRDTGLPAVTWHRNGVFFGHVLTGADAGSKRQMLLALIGALCPDLTGEMGRQVIASAGQMLQFRTEEETVSFIRERARQSGRLGAAQRHLEAAALRRAQAEEALQAGRFGDVLEEARQARDSLRAAFCSAFASREPEFRGVWVHSAFGVKGLTWDEAIGHLAAHGFNAVVPNMLWAGRAYYPSKVLPVMPEVEAQGDQIEFCLDACRRHGVAMHVWKVNWNLSGAPPEFVERMREEGRLQVDREGSPVRWLCPSDPRNFELERDSMLEVVREYPVDGVHFDYIRYPNANSCYCTGCRRRFEEATGTSVANWPQGVLHGERRGEYLEWRCEQITRLVEAVSREARRIRPGVQVSAAVFSRYPDCRERVGQDWVSWVERGYLDFICPMDYTADDLGFAELVSGQVGLVKGKVPLYPGIGASAPGLGPERVVWQVELARDAGAPGFMVFQYDRAFAHEHLPALATGATRRTENDTP